MGTYLADGILYCDICHTKKQHRLKDGTLVPCLCRCEAEERDRAYAERRMNERKRQARLLKDGMGLDDSHTELWTFAADDGTDTLMRPLCEKYVANFADMLERGKGILFYGNVGTGKTFWAGCIKNAVQDKGYSALMTSITDICNAMPGIFDGRQEWLDRLQRFNLLVIDDFRAERDTEYVNEIAFNVLNARYVRRLPTILTSNITLDEIMHPKDQSNRRMYSRIREMCALVGVGGADRRIRN